LDQQILEQENKEIEATVLRKDIEEAIEKSNQENNGESAEDQMVKMAMMQSMS